MSKLDLHEILEKSHTEASSEDEGLTVGTRSPSGTHVKTKQGWKASARPTKPHRIIVRMERSGSEYETVLDGVRGADHREVAKKILDAHRKLQTRYPDLKLKSIHAHQGLAKDGLGGAAPGGEMNKSIVQTNIIGVDLNTAEQSVDELASRQNHPMVEQIKGVLNGLGYASLPAEIVLPLGYKLYGSKVDDGMFSAVVKRWSNDGERGKVVMNLQKMTAEAIVQALKAKGFLSTEPAQSEAPPQPIAQDLIAALAGAGKEVHIHLSKATKLGQKEQMLLGPPSSGKVTRDSFGYDEPKGDAKNFAQCGTCWKWTGKTCLEFDDQTPVASTDSCNLYAKGKPRRDLIGQESGATRPLDVGFVKRPVRCENCASFDSERSICRLYTELNKVAGDRFDLNPAVKPLGCCTAQTPKGLEKSVSAMVEEQLDKSFAVGTIRTYRDGRQYQKLSDGTWKPLHASGKDEDSKQKPRKLTHYSQKQGLEKLDPAQMGTGAPSSEYKHGLPAVPRTYYYQEGTKPEDLVLQSAKAQYAAELSEEHKIYDLAQDPDGLVHKTVEANQGAWNPDLILQAIKDAGYYGFENSGSPLPGVVALFHPHPVKEEPIKKSHAEVLVTQGLAPTPEAKAAAKVGSEVTYTDAHALVESMLDDFDRLRWTLKEFHRAGAYTFAARLKDPGSLLRKMHGKLAKRTLDTVTDVVGARVLCRNLAGQQAALNLAKGMLDIVELEHSVIAARDGGYRAVHLLFKTASGRVAELQIKTALQQLFSSFTYVPIYKGGLLGRPEVESFLERLSDTLSQIDRGAPVPSPAERPEEPKVLRELGILFPWDRLGQLSEVVQKGLEAPVKHYLLEGEAAMEFDSTADAWAWAEKRRAEGYVGSLVLTYAPDREGLFLAVGNYAKPAPADAGASGLSDLAQALSRVHG